MDLIITILPVVTKDLPISSRFTPYNFLSRCKFSTLTARQPMVEFHLLTFPRFPLRKKEHKSNFGKNRTHDFRTSRCAGYLPDHSSDELQLLCTINHINTKEKTTNSPTSNPQNPGFNNGVRKDFAGFARVIKLLQPLSDCSHLNLLTIWKV